MFRFSLDCVLWILVSWSRAVFESVYAARKTIWRGDSLAGIFASSRRAVFIWISAGAISLVMLLGAAEMAHAEQMVASWYGPGFEGATTASGETFNPNDYTAAHKTLPFGTKLIVTYNGRSVVVRINDRGPYVAGRDLDLSQAAAEYIGLTAAGEATVEVSTADPSTPTGPYSPNADTTDATAQTPTQPPSPDTQGAGGKKRAASPNRSGGGAQDAAKDQYAVQTQATPPPPPAETQPAAPPPTPDPSRVEKPPAELNTPGSTVERRVVLFVGGFAKAPEPQPASETTTPAPKAATSAAQATPEATTPAPQAMHAVQTTAPEKGVPGISVLPDTGGAPLWTLVGGGLLAGAGALMLRGIRR